MRNVNVGDFVCFSYNGKVRTGTVNYVTSNVLNIWDTEAGHYKSYSHNRISPAPAELTMKEIA